MLEDINYVSYVHCLSTKLVGTDNLYRNFIGLVLCCEEYPEKAAFMIIREMMKEFYKNYKQHTE